MFAKRKSQDIHSQAGSSPGSEKGAPQSAAQPREESEVDYFHARVIGRVQGVGFRFWTCDIAESMGVNGWVQNCENGDVELEAEGPHQTLEDFAAKLNEGPALARVRKIEIQWGRRTPTCRSFEIERGGWFR